MAAEPHQAVSLIWLAGHGDVERESVSVGGLLNQVVDSRIQRTVMLALLMQFGGQILGISLAGLVETSGPVWILMVQTLILVVGIYAFYRVEAVPSEHRPRNNSLFGELLRSILEGGRSVWQSNKMRMVVFQNVAMGTFFMGLMCGFLVARFGPQTALVVASSSMLVTVVCVGVFSRLWLLDARLLRGMSDR